MVISVSYYDALMEAYSSANETNLFTPCMSGPDLSPDMVKLARERLGDDADLRVGDFGELGPTVLHKVLRC